MHLVEYMDSNNKSTHLDPETRLMTTGGWKRVKGEVPREMFIERTSKAFGISGAQIRDSLGLTDIFTMLPECEYHKKHVPPWFHVSVRNPENTTEEEAEGETGLLVFMSALIQSYPAFCMTGDMGAVEDGVCECGRAGQIVEHRGRAQGAGARGCALRLEEFMNKIQS
jgi:long-chain-fatty-acid---luciferin-component ligase